MAEVNIDAQLIRGSANDGDSNGVAAASVVPPKLVELTNGCICCSLREDLLVEVARYHLPARRSTRGWCW